MKLLRRMTRRSPRGRRETLGSRSARNCSPLWSRSAGSRKRKFGVITVTDDGFEYAGTSYPSLTKIAKKITGVVLIGVPTDLPPGFVRLSDIARSPEPVPPTRLPWRSRAIGSCESMVRCPAIGGASSASATCSTEKQNHEPRTSSDKVGQHRAAGNFPNGLASHY